MEETLKSYWNIGLYANSKECEIKNHKQSHIKTIKFFLIIHRTPKNAVYNSCDFAEVAFCVLKNRCGNGGEVSIQEINTNLDRIAAGHSSNDRSNYKIQ